MATKPKIFIASSSEALREAQAINTVLDHDFEPTLWTSGTFSLSSTTLPDLVSKSSYVDFAVFIFTPDDIANIREKSHQVARDNVVFELGLFIGAIGRERSFIIQPRDTKLHLPSDLLGVNTANYDANRADGDLQSAMNSPCTHIRNEANKLGILNREFISSNNTVVANPKKFEVTDLDIKVLANCLPSKTKYPTGIVYNLITNQIEIEETLILLSSVKLQKMGLIKTSVEIEEHQNGQEEYLVYMITELGTDYLLENEQRLIDMQTSYSNRSKNPKVSAQFDDDIPF